MNRKSISTYLLFTLLVVVISSAISPVVSSKNNTRISSYGTVNYSRIASTPIPSPSPTPTPTPTPTRTPSPSANGGIYLIYQGQPADVLQRIINAKQAYGRPEWVEFSASLWGALSTSQVDQLHAVGILVGGRVWTNFGQWSYESIVEDIDTLLAYTPNIDSIMLDCAVPDYPDLYKALSDYIHSKGKMACANYANFYFWLDAEQCSWFEHIELEFWWYKASESYDPGRPDLLSAFPTLFGGESNDWGYEYDGAKYPSGLPPASASGSRPAWSAPMSLERAVWDTQTAWSRGVSWHDSKTGEGYYLPSWWEEYLSQLPK